LEFLPLARRWPGTAFATLTADPGPCWGVVCRFREGLLRDFATVRRLALTLIIASAASLCCVNAFAQGTPAPPAAPAPAQAERSDPDIPVDPLQPDFTLAALPTTLRMPLHKFAFRVTHRFTRPLGEGDFGDLLSDAFGIDGGAQIGLELRFGLFPGTQIGVHRTSDRTIQIFGQHNFLKERDGKPIGLDVLATLEGEQNLTDHPQSALGVLVSRNIQKFVALYAEPMVVINSSSFSFGDSSTGMIGLGARLRVRPSLYLTGEITPRFAGYDPGVSQVSFGIEGRAGGHLFQINFSNGFATTLGQISRGAADYDNWFFGFNISRKFF
jgi:Membrane bound beta barrel domain (DUF5777)